MANILLLTNEIHAYQELITNLQKKDISVSILPMNTGLFEDIVKNKDIILVHLTEDQKINLQRISELKKFNSNPLFAMKVFQSNAERVFYLENGADSYIDMPYDVLTTTSRIAAIMRLIKVHKPLINNSIQIGELNIDLSTYKVTAHRKTLMLTKTEFKILLLMARYKDTFISKDYLANSVWDTKKVPTDNAITIQITRLRQKMISNLGIDCIKTLWGVGYKLNVSACNIKQ